ncbi:MAG TPA: DUF2924 domain-containing protein [Bryobacteraceae bacterium]|nr:hypothetical protein [Bryobacterales bacterium]HRJ17878.1 DUF2924 domain-containing protein [Bryobacteraceae bacterium]
MKKTLRDRIDELAAMNVKALQAEHVKLFGQPAVSAHRQFLFRKIAWQVQAEAHGWLPEAAVEIARGIARDTPLRARVLANTAKRRAGLPEDQVRRRRSNRRTMRASPWGIANCAKQRQADRRKSILSFLLHEGVPV